MFYISKIKTLSLALLLTAPVVGASVSPAAAAVNYVKVCDAQGVGYAYVPGTDRCVNLNDVGNSRQTKQNTDGVAIGMSLLTPVLPAGKDFGVSGGWGGFDGSNAVSVGGIYRVKDDFYLTGGVGVGTETGVVGGRAGFMYAW